MGNGVTKDKEFENIKRSLEQRGQNIRAALSSKKIHNFIMKG